MLKINARKINKQSGIAVVGSRTFSDTEWGTKAEPRFVDVFLVNPDQGAQHLPDFHGFYFLRYKFDGFIECVGFLLLDGFRIFEENKELNTQKFLIKIKFLNIVCIIYNKQIRSEFQVIFM